MTHPCRLVLPLLLVACAPSSERRDEAPAAPSPVATAASEATTTTSQGPGPAPVATLPPGARRSPADCADCHAEVVAEWQGSMHARSAPDDDPLYAFMLKKAEAKDARLGETCRRCHQPPWRAAAEAAGLEPGGVGCAVCHPVTADHPQDGSRPGVADAQALCLGCHREMRTPDGRPVCTTGAEHADADAAACVACHMPEQGGRRTHGFPGGHTPAFLTGAARLDLTQVGEAVQVTVTPVGVGHALPTGTPMRYLVLELTVLDGDGQVLWRNVEGAGPPFDTPEALFMRYFTGPDGSRPVPPFLSEAPPTDHRLGPGETRTVRAPLPEAAHSVTAVLRYHLAPPKVLQGAGAPVDWTRPVTVAEAHLRL